MGEQLLTLREAAAWLHVPEATLRWWRHRGEGPRGFRMGGRRVMFRERELRRWCTECEATDPRTPNP